MTGWNNNLHPYNSLYCLLSLLPPHTVQSSDEEVLAELVFVAQEGTLLQRDRHGGPVFGTFTAGQPDAI